MCTLLVIETMTFFCYFVFYMKLMHYDHFHVVTTGFALLPFKRKCFLNLELVKLVLLNMLSIFQRQLNNRKTFSNNLIMKYSVLFFN